MLTKFQYESSYLVAESFAHNWARSRHISDFEPDPEKIRRHTEEKEIERSPDQPWPGITAPEMDSRGNAVHCSGTGRYCWSVSPDGSVTFSVNRPDGPVFLGHAARKQFGHADPVWQVGWAQLPYPSAEARHWDALGDLLLVFGDFVEINLDWEHEENPDWDALGTTAESYYVVLGDEDDESGEYPFSAQIDCSRSGEWFVTVSRRGNILPHGDQIPVEDFETGAAMARALMISALAGGEPGTGVSVMKGEENEEGIQH